MQTITTEELAHAIYRRCAAAAVYDDRPLIDLAREINDGEGWTFEASTDQADWVVVSEGVRFSDAQLAEAAAIAATL